MTHGEQITKIANQFMEHYIWPRYGALGGPGIQECEEIVRAVLGCLPMDADAEGVAILKQLDASEGLLRAADERIDSLVAEIGRLTNELAEAEATRGINVPVGELPD